MTPSRPRCSGDPASDRRGIRQAVLGAMWPRILGSGGQRSERLIRPSGEVVVGGRRPSRSGRRSFLRFKKRGHQPALLGTAPLSGILAPPLRHHAPDLCDSGSDRAYRARSSKADSVPELVRADQSEADTVVRPRPKAVAEGIGQLRALRPRTSRRSSRRASSKTLETFEEAGAEARRRLGIPPDAQVVLDVGSGDLRKGIDIFLPRRQARDSTRLPISIFVWERQTPSSNISPDWLEQDLALGAAGEASLHPRYLKTSRSTNSAADGVPPQLPRGSRSRRSRWGSHAGRPARYRALGIRPAPAEAGPRAWSSVVGPELTHPRSSGPPVAATRESDPVAAERLVRSGGLREVQVRRRRTPSSLLQLLEPGLAEGLGRRRPRRTTENSRPSGGGAWPASSTTTNSRPPSSSAPDSTGSDDGSLAGTRSILPSKVVGRFSTS